MLLIRFFKIFFQFTHIQNIKNDIKRYCVIIATMKVIKRDNSTEDYDLKKIENVLNVAVKNSNTLRNKLPEIVTFINKEIDGIDNINIEDKSTIFFIILLLQDKLKNN